MDSGLGRMDSGRNKNQMELNQPGSKHAEYDEGRGEGVTKDEDEFLFFDSCLRCVARGCNSGVEVRTTAEFAGKLETRRDHPIIYCCN